MDKVISINIIKKNVNIYIKLINKIIRISNDANTKY